MWKRRVIKLTKTSTFRKLRSCHPVPSLHGKWMGKQWQTLYFGAPKSLQMVTAAMKLKDTCSLEEKLYSILKSKDITLLTKVHLVKAMVFPVVMYGCENWTIKKAEHQRTDAFELWCWRRLLRVPWTATSPSWRKSVLNIHRKDWCWSWNSNTSAIWCEELTHWKRSWIWERLKVGQEGDDRGWDGWMESPTQRTWVWASFKRWWRTGKPGILQSMRLQRVRHDWATGLNWTQEYESKF